MEEKMIIKLARLFIFIIAFLFLGYLIGVTISRDYYQKTIIQRQISSVPFHAAMQNELINKAILERQLLTELATASGTASLEATTNQLLASNEKIGSIYGAYYKADGKHLSALLDIHTRGILDMFQAHRIQETVAITKTITDWYANGKQIADLVNSKSDNPFDNKELYEDAVNLNLDLTREEMIAITNKDEIGEKIAYNKIYSQSLMLAKGL